MTLKDLRDKIDGLADAVELEVVMEGDHYRVSACAVVQQPTQVPVKTTEYPGSVKHPLTTHWEPKIIPLVRIYI